MTQQQEHTTWSDNDIIAAYRKAFGKSPDVHRMALMRWMRDDMQTQLAAAHAEVERLRAERDELNATLDEKARSHAELLIAWYKLTGDWDRVTQENAELRRGQYVPVAEIESVLYLADEYRKLGGGNTYNENKVREWLCRLAPQARKERPCTQRK